MRLTIRVRSWKEKHLRSLDDTYWHCYFQNELLVTEIEPKIGDGIPLVPRWYHWKAYGTDASSVLAGLSVWKKLVLKVRQNIKDSQGRGD